MEPTQPPPDPMLNLALRQLADITTPPPVSWMPQTWGWALLGIIIVLLALAALVRWLRWRAANRYRREALLQLDQIERGLQDPAGRGEALVEVPELLKRVALAAWPRADVASLSGESWLTFLRGHGGKQHFPAAADRLLEEVEYRSLETRKAVGESDARMLVASARSWIEGHVVSA